MLSSGKRGPGRTRKVHGPGNTSNPAFRAFRATCAIEEIVYDAIQRVAGLRAPASVALADARPLLNSIAVSDVGVDPRTFRANVADLALPPAAQARRAPQTRAGELTSWLLGKGRWWFRDLLRSVPKDWRPSRRHRFSVASHSTSADRHAGRRDLFTPSERVFYDARFPAHARQVIEAAARDLRGRAGCCDLQRKKGASRLCDACAATKYLESAAALRALTSPPSGLEAAVWSAVKALPSGVRRKVFAQTRRYTRRTGRVWRLTPLPAIGPPPQRPFRPREPAHP